MKSHVREGIALAIFVLLLGSYHQMQAQADESGIVQGTFADSAIAPQSVVRNCGAPLNKLSFAVTSGPESRSMGLTTFLDLPPLKVTFSIPSTACMRVDVAAVTFAPNSALYMRVLLDGVEMAPGGLLQWSGRDTIAQAHSAEFFAFGVSAGTHTVRVQWRSDTQNLVYAYWRSLAVLHN